MLRTLKIAKAFVAGTRRDYIVRTVPTFLSRSALHGAEMRMQNLFVTSDVTPWITNQENFDVMKNRARTEQWHIRRFLEKRDCVPQRLRSRIALCDAIRIWHVACKLPLSCCRDFAKGRCLKHTRGPNGSISSVKPRPQADRLRSAAVNLMP